MNFKSTIKLLYVAFSLIVILIIVGIYFKHNGRIKRIGSDKRSENVMISYCKIGNDTYKTITTSKEKYLITLPDGSKIWLNKMSSLKFPTDFGGMRKVQLRGDGYLEVSLFSDSGKSLKPFKVDVLAPNDSIEYTLLSGKLVVNAGGGDSVISSIMVEGNAQLHFKSSYWPKGVTMKPGQPTSLFFFNGYGTTLGQLVVPDTATIKTLMKWMKEG